jgi:hypothetical protein
MRFGLLAAIIAALLLAVAPAQASGTHRAYLPMVAAAPPPKAGIAFSSHQDAAERVVLLGDTVSHWRGWRNNWRVGERWGLRNTPSLHADLYWQWRPGLGDWRLQDQLYVLDKLGPDYDGYLLFVNEPDLKPELHPIRMAQLYVHVKHFMPDVQLVGPGISHRDYQADFYWLGQWFDAVVRITGEPPEMYAWDIHNYLHDGDPLAPYDALELWLNERGVYNPKFWPTEWGARTPERTLEMKRAFDADPRIIGHNWYDQYAAWWDGDNRPLQLFVGGEEGGGPIRLSRLGIAWKYDREPAPGEVERGALPQMD